jgi:hypothetical protein
VLDTLTRGPATAGELAALLPIARPGVSRVLREAGLVEVRMEDRFDTDIDDLWSALTDPGRLARWHGEFEAATPVSGLSPMDSAGS